MARPVVETETDAVVEVEFRITDPSYPLVSIPEETGCRVQVEQIVPRGGDTYAVYYQMTGASTDRIIELVNEYGTLEAREVSRYDDGGVIEVLVNDSRKHLIVTLTDTGAIPRDVWSADGVAHIVAEISSVYHAPDVVDRFRSVHPSVEVVAQRQKEHAVPMFTRREFQRAVENLLTPRQSEVLRAAYDIGYFEWPRENSGEEVASALEIAHPTFSQHLRTAERKVFSLLFDER